MGIISAAAPAIFATDLGWIGIDWDVQLEPPLIAKKNGQPKYQNTGSPTEAFWMVKRLTFGHRTRQDVFDHWQLKLRSKPKPNLQQRAILERITKYAAGEPTDLSDIPVAIGDRTLFQQAVLKACQAVPWGDTLSYAGLAKAAGRPKSARAVGNVMATNRTPLLIPCHRIVASGGKLGGFTAPGGVDTKQRLLKLESVDA